MRHLYKTEFLNQYLYHTNSANWENWLRVESYHAYVPSSKRTRVSERGKK